jgi:AraC-like DNA-binding protein
MTLPIRELFDYLRSRPHDTFSTAGLIDERRYLPRRFPDDFPLLVSVQAYPAYRRMIGENWMHWHDYYELWLATDGGGVYRSGNHRFSFAPGDIVLVDPLKIHGVVRMEKGHAPLVVFFPVDAVAAGGGKVDLGFLAAWDRRPDTVLPRVEGDSPTAAPVHRALLRLVRAWFEVRSGEERALVLKFHLLEVLMHLRHALVHPRKPAPDARSMRGEREARLGRVLEYVAQHSQERVSQPEAARVAGMSTSRFRVFFKETTGWGFSDYLRELRLEQAARLLRETAESVAAIAHETGFSDQSHLQRLFKAKHTISPLAYRKHHRATNGASE